MARPVITFYDDIPMVEIIFSRVIGYDNSEFYGTHTFHYSAGKLAAIEIHDAVVNSFESTGVTNQIGEFGQDEPFEEQSSAFVPDQENEPAFPGVLTELPLSEDAVRNHSHGGL